MKKQRILFFFLIILMVALAVDADGPQELQVSWLI